jgi:imidazole glycerol-phosphate synthase subunit HisF
VFRPRIIPVLLLKENILVKSTRFKKHRYIGDPINAVRIFNNHRADELIFLDISATRNRRTISTAFVKKVGEEADMPFAVGGGIDSIKSISEIIAAGAEKIVIGSGAALNKGLVKAAADTFGASAISVCMDVRKNFFGEERVWIKNGSKSTGYVPEVFAKMMEESGAGELVVQSIPHDGMMQGYNIDLLRRVALSTTIPIVALGGAGNFNHLREAYKEGLVTALAAGSFFLYRSSKKGVLLNYPEDKNIF